MKTFSLDKEKARGLIFDIDLTLYDNRHYYESQENLVMNKLAEVLNRSCSEVITEVIEWREEIKEKTGKRPPLGGAIAEKYNIPISEVVKWREELFHPESFLQPDRKLHDTLSKLKTKYHIAAVTNNPTSIAMRTLKALQIESFFQPVIGLDVTFISKPTMAPYRLVMDQLSMKPEELVSIGDRFEVDLELPVSSGMAGILVESLDDAYSLADILL